MLGYDTSDGWKVGPLDDRDSDDPEFSVDPELSEKCAHGHEHDPL